MSDYSNHSVKRCLLRRQFIREELAVTPQHLYPLLYASLCKELADVNERLAQLAGEPVRRVALRRSYDENSRLEDELDDVHGPGRFGY